jgi:hypothetical protein
MGSKIIGYSSTKLPEALTAPEYVISIADRTRAVLRGAIRESNHRRPKKKGDKVSYGAIFCDKEASLPNGLYVFRVNGALSAQHTYSETKWEFCGYRGTSAEELQFSMTDGVCTPRLKRSRWELSGPQSLVVFTASLNMHFDDLSTVQALTDVSYNEIFLGELESAVFAGMSIMGSSLVVAASVNSVELNDGALHAIIGLRINTAAYETQESLSQDEKNVHIASVLQEQLASGATVAAIVNELHKYPEFAAISNVGVSDISFDRSFEIPTHGAPQYTTDLGDNTHISTQRLSAPYAVIALLGFAVLGAVMRRFA